MYRNIHLASTFIIIILMKPAQDKEQQSILNTFDFSYIEEQDPGIVGGYHIIYDREVPFEIRSPEANISILAHRIHRT